MEDDIAAAWSAGSLVEPDRLLNKKGSHKRAFFCIKSLAWGDFPGRYRSNFSSARVVAQ